MYTKVELMEMLRTVCGTDGRWVLQKREELGSKAMRKKLSTSTLTQNHSSGHASPRGHVFVDCHSFKLDEVFTFMFGA
jgi:hypothetical protein